MAPAPDAPTTPDSPPPAAPSRLQRLRDIPVNGWIVAAFLVALTAVSLVLRTRQLHFHYWIDEAISMGISSHPLGQLPDLLRQDGSPPLYYVLLHVWMQAFGRGEVATHVLSLIFALVAIPVAYWGGTSLFGRRAGAFTAILAAGVTFLTDYAQETRMYSLLALLSLVAAIAFVQVYVFRRRRYLPIFSLSLAATLYTHNWALFFGLASFVAFASCVWATSALERRALVRDGLIGFGAVALLYLPWLPILIYQARHTGAPWALAPRIWSITQGLYFITGGRGTAVALLLAGGSGLVAIHAARLKRRSTALTWRATTALAVLGFGTLLIAWAYAKTTPAWSFRYLAVIVGPLLVLFGLALSRARGLGIAALVLVCCFWMFDPRPSSLDTKSNVAAVAHVMAPHLRSDTLVVSTQPEQVPTLAYYLPHASRFLTPLGSVPDPRVVDWRNALGRFEHSSVAGTLAPAIASLAPGQRVLLVTPTSFAKAPLWLSLIRRSSRSWTRYLLHDPNLRLLSVSARHQYSANVAVQGALFEVTGGR